MVPAKGRSPGDIEQSMTTVGLGKPAMVSKLEHLLESRPRKNHAALNSVSFPLLEVRRNKFPALRPKGGLAQLVERLLCKQNVNGSNPLTSTIFS